MAFLMASVLFTGSIATLVSLFCFNLLCFALVNEVTFPFLCILDNREAIYPVPVFGSKKCSYK